MGYDFTLPFLSFVEIGIKGGGSKTKVRSNLLKAGVELRPLRKLAVGVLGRPNLPHLLDTATFKGSW